MRFMLRWIPFLVVLGVMGAVLAVPVVGQATEDARVYLPLVAHQRTYSPSLSVYGRAYRLGYSNNITLTLDYFDGITTTTFATTPIIRPFYYYFLNLPLLNASENYRVSFYNGQYGNPQYPQYVKVWHSFAITESVEGAISGGNFNLNNFPLLFPTTQRQVKVPFSFEWRLRINELDDNFVLTFYDMNEIPLYRTSMLHYTSTYEFNPLSVGLNVNTPYLWDVMISNPDGSIGIGYESKREVTFVEQELINTPTGLNSYCVDITDRTYMYCYFNWQPVEGANSYYIETPSFEGNGWVEANSVQGRVFCGATNRQLRVKARSDTAEGAFTETTYIGVSCTPPCSPCLREMFKEQAVWQPDRWEPY